MNVHFFFRAESYLESQSNNIQFLCIFEIGSAGYFFLPKRKEEGRRNFPFSKKFFSFFKKIFSFFISRYLFSKIYSSHNILWAPFSSSSTCAEKGSGNEGKRKKLCYDMQYFGRICVYIMDTRKC